VSNSGLYASALLFTAARKDFMQCLLSVRQALGELAESFGWSSPVKQEAELVRFSGLFDEDWYRTQTELLGLEFEGDPATHYVRTGWRSILSPSPYFDAQFVTKQLEGSMRKLCPLVVYLQHWRTKKINPSVLFDTDFYCAQLTEELSPETNPLTHYLQEGWKLNLTPSPLFDAKFYTTMYGGMSDSNSSWCHFMKHGRYEMRQPNAFFVPEYYRSQFIEQLGNVTDSALLLTHYLTSPYPLAVRPHPEFDPNFYAELATETTGENAPAHPLKHFLTTGRGIGLVPNEKLRDRLFAEFKSVPAESTLERNRLLDFAQSDFLLDTDISAWKRLQALSDSNKPVVIFAGHEASLTGAPMVLLSLVQNFAQEGYECLVLLLRGGPLVAKYEESAWVEVLDTAAAPLRRAEWILKALTIHLEKDRIIGAITNTAEAAHLQKIIRRQDVKVISLLHEFADSSQKEYIQAIYDSCDALVFSSEFLLEQANHKCNLDGVKAVVRPQGLLSPPTAIKEMSLDTARMIVRQEIGAAESSFIVFACGSLDLRKGIDLFAQIVPLVVSGESRDREVHFVWIGGGSKANHTPYYYAAWDLKQQGLLARTHFLEPRELLDPWFLGSDVFLLCSRQDPFPCVAQSAMSAAIPVVAFDGAGGIPELISAGGGTIVPYCNTAAAAEAINRYYTNEELRCQHGRVGQQLMSDHFSFIDYYSYVKELLLEPAEESLESITNEHTVSKGEQLSVPINSAPSLALLGQQAL
jgi:glycosyltransferase involved in cell wall biosynthesis